MAINDIYNSLTFGDVNSLDYGIFISGPGVYDAPERDVNLVNVPGRNGDIEIDKGHWNNIEVRYRAGTFGDNQTDFADSIRAFRNAIASQTGYNRLTDTYNPNEYRLGIFLNGIDVEPVSMNRAGDFEIKFNCKPQRYLLEGETELNVSSGEAITNPTLLQSAPVVKLQGYGTVTINDDAIIRAHVPLGPVKVANGGTFVSEPSTTESIASSGNIYFDVSQLVDRDYIRNNYEDYSISIVLNVPKHGIIKRTLNLNSTFNINVTAQYDTEREEVVFSSEQASVWAQSSTSLSYEISVKGKAIYTARSDTPYAEYQAIATLRSCSVPDATVYGEVILKDFYGYSNKDTIDNEIIIDCESGISWMETEEGKVSTDNFLTLPPNLVRLDAGDNLVTFDNTIDYVKIIPKWWEL